LSLSPVELRLGFFDYLFEEREGFICIAYRPAKSKGNKDFKQQFFSWPSQRLQMGAFIDNLHTGHNLWFGVNLFRRPERKRDYALPTRLVWADLDFCNPGEVTPAPQCRIESSPQRYQAIWRLDELVIPEEAQALSKRIAYAYADQGADKSGWDIEQLLRVPFTYNYKYDDGAQVPDVKLLSTFEALLPKDVFSEITTPTPEEQAEKIEPMPDILSLPPVSGIIYKYQNELRRTNFTDTFTVEPSEDWSGVMWHLINLCLESGMAREEVFAVALESKCNKYERDNRPIEYLWREVLKADWRQRQVSAVMGEAEPLIMPTLYEGDPPETIIDRYKKWAAEATDAVEEYHELSCVILLSTLLSGNLHCDTSFGNIIPNLWGLILGDSTLTRKSTAMRMGLDLITTIDRELVVATDGSAEGVLSAIATRPSQVSMFFKDEVAGFIDSINKKDYLAGMPEILTNLYDVPEFYMRRLRKENIVISKPVFIFFGGGIRDKMYELLSERHVLTGFLPRFLVVGGDADLSKMRPAGPLVPGLAEKRQKLLSLLQELYLTYGEEAEIEVPNANTTFSIPIDVKAVLTDDAWTYFESIQVQMATAAEASSFKIVAQPTFDRLAWSCFKMGMLLAASRQEPVEQKITIELRDLQAAAYYIQRWGIHSIDLITNVGRTTSQKQILQVLSFIKGKPGCWRADISRNFHLNKRELDLILETLLDRNHIRLKKLGRGYQIYPIGGS
jgi:RepB DNA-primase from phage plasmid/Protein of unknown function (DUF3987)